MEVPSNTPAPGAEFPAPNDPNFSPPTGMSVFPEVDPPSYPPFANDALHLLDNPPQRQETGYLPPAEAVAWCKEVELEIVSPESTLSYFILSHLTNLNPLQGRLSRRAMKDPQFGLAMLISDAEDRIAAMQVDLRTDEVARQGKARAEEEAKAEAKRRVEKELADSILAERTKREMFDKLAKELGLSANAGNLVLHMTVSVRLFPSPSTDFISFPTALQQL